MSKNVRLYFFTAVMLYLLSTSFSSLFAQSLPNVGLGKVDLHSYNKGKAGTSGDSDGKSKPETSFGYVWYLSYLSNSDFSKFYMHRGYINIKTKFSSRISTRITPDVTQDKEGDGEGDIEVRLKYAYMKFSLPGNSFFTKPAIEFGLVHKTWLDFEEHINYYRCQGTMFLERTHLFNSADFGISFFSLLGGEMDESYKKDVNNKYPGRYGSIAFGIYNGGGYHAPEKNNNKMIEGRITLRPLPDVIPGLQFSYYGVFGKGNLESEPDWRINTAFVSFEEKRLVLTSTYFAAKGNSKGNALDQFGNPLNQKGYSLFGELKSSCKLFSIFGRYDYYEKNTGLEKNETKRTIAGVAYHFMGHHKAVLDYDTIKYAATDETDSCFKFTIEVHH